MMGSLQTLTIIGQAQNSATIAMPTARKKSEI